MDMGTSLDGEAAVSEGLIDHLGNLSDAIACLYELIGEGGGGGGLDNVLPGSGTGENGAPNLSGKTL